MQIQVYSVPALEVGAGLAEMNRFLSGHRVLEVQQEFVSNEKGAYWCYCIRYLQGAVAVQSSTRKGKVDYKSVLDEKAFEKFSRLRICRKSIAAEDAVPAFAVFTDAELVKMAELEEITLEKMLGIKGIGKKRAEKYGALILEKYLTKT